jgi:hypothetical protein
MPTLVVTTVLCVPSLIGFVMARRNLRAASTVTGAQFLLMTTTNSSPPRRPRCHRDG